MEPEEEALKRASEAAIQATQERLRDTNEMINESRAALQAQGVDVQALRVFEHFVIDRALQEAMLRNAEGMRKAVMEG